MHRELVKVLVIAAALAGGFAGCSRSHNNAGAAEADGLSPDQWRPSADAIAAATREKKAPMIVARTTQPRASAYDLNPRAAEQPHQSQSTDSIDSPPNEQGAEDDPAIGGMEKLPPPPLPKIASGDEADQFGLPEWEQIARGELQVKRIRY